MSDKMENSLKIALVLSSTRDGRLNDRVGKLVQRLIGSEIEVEILDPKCLETSNTQQSMNFLFNPSAVPDYIKDFNEKLKEFDAFVFVCAEYNYSLPPGLTNMFGNFPPPTFIWKPCSVISYSVGPAGGIRAAIQLGTFVHALGMIVIPKQVAVPKAHETIDIDGNTKDDKLIEDIKLLLQDVYWAANAFKRYKTVTPAPQWTR